jgi:hypothetical protein
LKVSLNSPHPEGTTGASIDLFLASSSSLGLLGTSEFLGSVLALLALLAGDLLLATDTVSDESVLGLGLLGNVNGVVDQAETSGLATTENGLKTEGENALYIDGGRICG